MIRQTHTFNLLLLLASAVLSAACTGSKTSPRGNAYHNTTAHYNAYFYADQRINEMEQNLIKNAEKNYNRILLIYPPLDSGTYKAGETLLQDVIKKTSIAIQRHETSKWVDNSYVVLGKARLFSLDYANAVETFKYVNVKSKDDDIRHLALVWLLRTFTEAGEYKNAMAVADYLKREKLNKANRKLLFLTLAHYYQRTGDLDNMAKNLIPAVPLIRNHNEKANAYFIIGQTYQYLHFDALAYENYRSCLSNNPPYEQSFYAKLNMASVTQLSNSDDLKTVRKYFRKLLKDEKNLDYRDKIYYELANFELKQGNYDEAISNYRLSVKASTNNARQKGYSYLKLAELYYQHFKKYSTAKSYYDSTLSVLPKDEPGYEKLSERQKILTEFVQQITIIETQDSLLQLAAMPEEQLNTYLDDYIEAQKRKTEEKAAEEKRNKKKAGQAVAFQQEGRQINLTQQGTWYFYSTSAISQGRSQFARIWGSRPLEDNWRLSAGQRPISSPSTAAVPTAASDTTGYEQSTASISREELMKTIPFEPEAKETALAQIEIAYFTLGNIYNFQLGEKQNAGTTFDTHVRRFPDSEHAPEALYQLYLIYKELDSAIFESYKAQLISRFPQSIYAKLAINPRYKEESSLASAKLQKVYAEAYNFYQLGSYQEARKLTTEGLREYDDNEFTDNMKLLDIMLTAKLDDVYKYKFELGNFIDAYPESELIPYAQSLMTAYDEFQLNLVNSSAAKFKKDIDKQHFFILVYPPDSPLPDQLPGKMEQYIKNTMNEQGLSLGNLILDARRSVILVNAFDGKDSALAFYHKFNLDNTLLKEYDSVKFSNFVISKDNFNVLYQTKDVDGYSTFFNNNY